MSGVDKAEIRRQMRRLRRDLNEEEQQRAADGVYAQVMRMDCYRTARTVMAYAAVRGELSMRRIMEDIRASGRLLALPRCGESGDMDAFIVTEQRQLRQGAYGIWEPDESCPIVSPDAIDLMLIPGFAAFSGRSGFSGFAGFSARAGASVRAAATMIDTFSRHARSASAYATGLR